MLPPPIVLPIEVIGPVGYSETVTVDVQYEGRHHAGALIPTNPDRLYLKVHRPSYRDAGVNPGRGAKASVRLNGGPWVGLTDDVAECFAHEANFGCLSGFYHTLRFTVELEHFGEPGIRDGQNTIEFRFNGTDGLTIGYRVLELNLLDTNGTPLISQSRFVEDDPTTWTSPRPDPADLAEGARLWHEAELVEGLDHVPIRATCSSCHARDGRDLEYFSYSNWSIQERARFHGLSQVEAEQIASYIRSLDVPTPALGRPWNPPFQPGPGLDQRPVEEWSAGVGLEGVLETDAEMAPYLVTDQSNFSAEGTLNAREMPIALQLPDWNEWLPEIHPVDVWGNLFLNTAPVNGADGDALGDVLGYYERLVYRLQTEGPASLIQQNDLKRLVDDFDGAGMTYFWNADNGGGSQNLPAGMRPEVARRSIRKWTAIKLWEVHREFDMEGLAPDAYGGGGEVRSWIGEHRQVGTLAPHFSADVYGTYAHQTMLGGKTESTGWYHLQMITNAGNHFGTPENPVDWNYHPDQIEQLSLGSYGGPGQPIRAAQGWAKLIQLFHHDRELLDEAYVRQAHPGRWRGFTVFNELDVHARADLFTALLNEYMDVVESHDVSEWDRPLDPDTPERWESALYVPTYVTDLSLKELHLYGHYADLWFTMIPKFRVWGVRQDLIDRMIAWGAEMWPLGAWDTLDGDTAVFGHGDGLNGSYFHDVNLSELDFQRVDPVVKFLWPDGEGPWGNTGHNNFSARWEGYLLPLFTNLTTFYLKADDGMRMWVDGELVIDDWWTDGQIVTEQARVRLTAGRPVPIRIEYVERQGHAEIELSWSSALFERVVVPTTQLYSQVPRLAESAGTDAAAAGASALTFALSPGSPNPFATTSTLTYALPEAGTAQLEVYDLLGRRVAVLADGEHEAGVHTATLDARLLASGSYVCRLRAGNEVRTQKVLVVR